MCYQISFRETASALLVIVALAYSGFAAVGDCAVNFAVIGDRTGDHIEGIYGQIIEQVEKLHPDFAITVGDQIEGYVEDAAILDTEWAEYDSIVAALSVPLFITPGNHDITNSFMGEYYQAHRGEPYYSVDQNGIHLIVLDNSRYNTTTDFSSEQLDWLADDLEKNRDAEYTFAFMHKPFWFDTVADGNPDTLHSLFVKFGVDGVFSGHFHSYFNGTFDGINYTSVGSSGGDADPAPTGMHFHFVSVTIDDSGFSINPITLDGAVHPWDEVTVYDVKFGNQIRYRGVEIVRPLEIGQDLNLETQTLEVSVTNLNEGLEISDTIRWDLPEGWSVEPQMLPFTVPVGDKLTAEFKFSVEGELYPLPSFSLTYPFGSNKVYTVKKYARAVRSAECLPATEAPVIDGIVNDAAWGSPVSRLFSPDGGIAITDPVNFYFAYDTDNIYLAAYCSEPFVDSMKSGTTERDGMLFGDDCVGYFIQPDIDEGKAYMIYVNAIGTVFDQELVVGYDGFTDYDPKWDGSYEVVAGRGGDHWSVEIAIPLAQWGAKAESGQKWGINFRRKQPRFGSAADWQTPIDYAPDSYGNLIMK
ncbi:MAG: metallophosphoesterase [candidate division Zixibacteria bacterium]|nr:metallophosphoesterase [candidate division Zixibacteria bacterium]MBU1469235.1 metallophosphoesterase [candidate division Zixibacteria bacterium]MBU2626720.1 metallophosphoesterase [candidate division Zixibacteria bacterium]